MKKQNESVAEILRVNHAGEHGAISIYKAQLTLSRLLHPGIVSSLEEMLTHEKEHFRRFDDILKKRDLRSCHALFAWSMGGWLLGLFTALIGQRAIWVCTAAIESTVNEHLEQQISVLQNHDPEVLAAVEAIQIDEKAHEAHGRHHAGAQNWASRLLWKSITHAVGFAIWLSTRI